MSNCAAFIASQGAKATVGDAPMPKVKPGSVVVKNKAVAINPVDWKMRDFGIMVPFWPAIMGFDSAGEIHAVDDTISDDFKVGRRVLVRANGLMVRDTEQAAFQLYTTAPSSQVALIPDNISFEAAASLPMSIATAAAGLYEEDSLKLDLPTARKSRSAPESKKAILIWGAASSVGCSAVQLARASGIKVIATASSKNFDLVRSLSANMVVDYRDPNVVEKLYSAFKDHESVGAFDSVGLNSEQCIQVLGKLAGGHVATVLPSLVKDFPKGVTTHQVRATSITESSVGKILFHDFLPKALADGTFVPAPETVVVGHGLGTIEDGLARMKAGVSAQKLIVTL
ncbi:putative zinc-binding alcohol dehydrogenase domain-containing protein cipB [Polychaeton citri CBS 116435]|uniref:Zinc-binding alcohol dehydrogenase domain-containing protein cipB n=1 Tax=Polychaeton citri CBS 116435 TaxID=1314669 RepID=A0A9P4Q539_9PEZI|nr:putative zinc-binding alcohol dehydrogenase domain-containing protein cipB [Polychaeton citri CBS 116435]